MPVDYIYDIECYPNVFTVYIGNAETRKCKSFEISFRKNQYEEMIEYLRMIYRTKGRMIGYNNVAFDYTVLHYIMQNKNVTAKLIYHKAMDIINSENKFEHVIRDKDCFIPQIDLFKIHHFDNKARATSLKMLEFNMRSDNIEDLPFPVGKELTSDEIDILLKYNKHDMLQTFLFYQQSKTQIEFREKLTKQYNRNFMNHNDTKIGKDYFIMKLEEEMPGCCYHKNGKVKQTIRNSIKLNECIFDYIKYERPEFNAVLDWLKKQEITETKGVFSDILESDLGDLAKYCKMRTKRKKLPKEPTEEQVSKFKEEYPLCWIEKKELKSKKISYYLCWNIADNLNVIVEGMQYDLGTGGLHSAKAGSVICSDEKRIIKTYDVASYYPNLAIKNRVYPEHLGERFCDIYEDVYNQRKSYAKGTVENAMMKLALNGTYGASNDKFSPFYDPMFTMKITINGQLSLLMLVENLLKVPTVEIVMTNTDGLEFTVDREYEKQAHSVCEWWEELTKLTLEGDSYHSMYVADVNNYVAISESGKIKRKGKYCWKTIHHDIEDYELLWHQNHSSVVISMAAEKYFVEGIPIEDFIRNHKDKMDFMLRTKVPRSSRLVLVDELGIDQPAQNICRYYASTNGGNLVKIMPPVEQFKIVKKYVDTEGNEYYASTKGDITKYSKKYEYVGEVEQEQPERRIGINTGQRVTVCNDIKDFNGDIDYDFYIKEAKKLIEFSIDNNNQED